jgi:hypothetical protein
MVAVVVTSLIKTKLEAVNFEQRPYSAMKAAALLVCEGFDGCVLPPLAIT